MSKDDHEDHDPPPEGQETLPDIWTIFKQCVNDMKRENVPEDHFLKKTTSIDESEKPRIDILDRVFCYNRMFIYSTTRDRSDVHKNYRKIRKEPGYKMYKTCIIFAREARESLINDFKKIRGNLYNFIMNVIISDKNVQQKKKYTLKVQQALQRMQNATDIETEIFQKLSQEIHVSGLQEISVLLHQTKGLKDAKDLVTKIIPWIRERVGQRYSENFGLYELVYVQLFRTVGGVYYLYEITDRLGAHEKDADKMFNLLQKYNQHDNEFKFDNLFKFKHDLDQFIRDNIFNGQRANYKTYNAAPDLWFYIYKKETENNTIEEWMLFRNAFREWSKERMPLLPTAVALTKITGRNMVNSTAKNVKQIWTARKYSLKDFLRGVFKCLAHPMLFILMIVWITTISYLSISLPGINWLHTVPVAMSGGVVTTGAMVTATGAAPLLGHVLYNLRDNNQGGWGLVSATSYVWAPAVKLFALGIIHETFRNYYPSWWVEFHASSIAFLHETLGRSSDLRGELEKAAQTHISKNKANDESVTLALEDLESKTGDFSSQLFSKFPKAALTIADSAGNPLFNANGIVEKSLWTDMAFFPKNGLGSSANSTQGISIKFGNMSDPSVPYYFIEGIAMRQIDQGQLAWYVEDNQYIFITNKQTKHRVFAAWGTQDSMSENTIHVEALRPLSPIFTRLNYGDKNSFYQSSEFSFIGFILHNLESGEELDMKDFARYDVITKAIRTFEARMPERQSSWILAKDASYAALKHSLIHVLSHIVNLGLRPFDTPFQLFKGLGSSTALATFDVIYKATSTVLLKVIHVVEGFARSIGAFFKDPIESMKTFLFNAHTYVKQGVSTLTYKAKEMFWFVKERISKFLLNLRVNFIDSAIDRPGSPIEHLKEPAQKIIDFCTRAEEELAGDFKSKIFSDILDKFIQEDRDLRSLIEDPTEFDKVLSTRKNNPQHRRTEADDVKYEMYLKYFQDAEFSDMDFQVIKKYYQDAMQNLAENAFNDLLSTLNQKSVNMLTQGINADADIPLYPMVANQTLPKEKDVANQIFDDLIEFRNEKIEDIRAYYENQKNHEKLRSVIPAFEKLFNWIVKRYYNGFRECILRTSSTKNSMAIDPETKMCLDIFGAFFKYYPMEFYKRAFAIDTPGNEDLVSALNVLKDDRELNAYEKSVLDAMGVTKWDNVTVDAAIAYVHNDAHSSTVRDIQRMFFEKKLFYNPLQRSDNKRLRGAELKPLPAVFSGAEENVDIKRLIAYALYKEFERPYRSLLQKPIRIADSKDKWMHKYFKSAIDATESQERKKRGIDFMRSSDIAGKPITDVNSLLEGITLDDLIAAVMKPDGAETETPIRESIWPVLFAFHVHLNDPNNEDGALLFNVEADALLQFTNAITPEVRAVRDQLHKVVEAIMCSSDALESLSKVMGINDTGLLRHVTPLTSSCYHQDRLTDDDELLNSLLRNITDTRNILHKAQQQAQGSNRTIPYEDVEIIKSFVQQIAITETGEQMKSNTEGLASAILSDVHAFIKLLYDFEHTKEVIKYLPHVPIVQRIDCAKNAMEDSNIASDDLIPCTPTVDIVHNGQIIFQCPLTKREFEEIGNQYKKTVHRMRQNQTSYDAAVTEIFNITQPISERTKLAPEDLKYDLEMLDHLTSLNLDSGFFKIPFANTFEKMFRVFTSQGEKTVVVTYETRLIFGLNTKKITKIEYNASNLGNEESELIQQLFTVWLTSAGYETFLRPVNDADITYFIKFLLNESIVGKITVQDQNGDAIDMNTPDFKSALDNYINEKRKRLGTYYENIMYKLYTEDSKSNDRLRLRTAFVDEVFDTILKNLEDVYQRRFNPNEENMRTFMIEHMHREIQDMSKTVREGLSDPIRRVFEGLRDLLPLSTSQRTINHLNQKKRKNFIGSLSTRIQNYLDGKVDRVLKTDDELRVMNLQSSQRRSSSRTYTSEAIEIQSNTMAQEIKGMIETQNSGMIEDKMLQFMDFMHQSWRHTEYSHLVYKNMFDVLSNVLEALKTYSRPIRLPRFGAKFEAFYENLMRDEMLPQLPQHLRESLRADFQKLRQDMSNLFELSNDRYIRKEIDRVSAEYLDSIETSVAQERERVLQNIHNESEEGQTQVSEGMEQIRETTRTTLESFLNEVERVYGRAIGPTNTVGGAGAGASEVREMSSTATYKYTMIFKVVELTIGFVVDAYNAFQSLGHRNIRGDSFPPSEELFKGYGEIIDNIKERIRKDKALIGPEDKEKLIHTFDEITKQMNQIMTTPGQFDAFEPVLKAIMQRDTESNDKGFHADRKNDIRIMPRAHARRYPNETDSNVVSDSAYTFPGDPAPNPNRSYAEPQETQTPDEGSVTQTVEVNADGSLTSQNTTPNPIHDSIDKTMNAIQTQIAAADDFRSKHRYMTYDQLMNLEHDLRRAILNILKNGLHELFVEIDLVNPIMSVDRKLSFQDAFVKQLELIRQAAETVFKKLASALSKHALIRDNIIWRFFDMINEKLDLIYNTDFTFQEYDRTWLHTKVAAFKEKWSKFENKNRPPTMLDKLKSLLPW